jgi:hypothetical protein
MKRTDRWLILAGILPLLAAGAKPAAAAIIVVDELGNGFVDFTPMGSAITADLGPGGLPMVLTYGRLPFEGTQGDVLMQEANVTSDVLRFPGDASLRSHSGISDDGADALGDFGLPTAFYPNQAFIPELGPEGNNRATYTPLPGQPGFDASNPTYVFVSDGVAQAAPEPGTLALTGLGMLGMAV